MNYYKELKNQRRVFYVGSTGLEIIVEPDGEAGHRRLTKEERREFNIKMKIENLLAKSVETRYELDNLISIPYKE